MSFAKNGGALTLYKNMWIIITLVALLSAYIVFIFAPSVVAYCSVFSRKTTTPLRQRKSLSYYEPFIDKIEASASYLSGLEKRAVTLRSFDGVRLYGELYDGSLSKTAICFHGYASGAAYNFAVQGEFLHRKGFNVLLVHQRAHDKSGGKNTCFGLVEQYDLLGWIDKAREITGNTRILLYGISMGCATVGYASDKLDSSVVRGMILDCGFTSPYDQLKRDHIIRRVPWRLMLPIECALAKINLRIDLKQPVAASLKNTAVPAFFIHGEDDTTVPAAQGRINFEACSSEKRCAFIKGGAHTVSFIAGGERLQGEISEFLGKYFN